MGNKTYLGIDIGHERLKLALVKGGKVVKTASAQMPENLIKNGRIVSPETMASLIKDTVKENNMKERSAALLLPADAVYVRNISMPVMSADQLDINLPFEFRDYFNEELHEYYYDYSIYDTAPEEGSMEMLAGAVRKELIADFNELLKRCGMKADIIAPSATALQNVIRNYEKSNGAKEEEYCFLDLGHKNFHMNFYRGDRHIAMRELESSLEAIDNVIANLYNVDKHLAHTYVAENFENCQDKQAAVDVYSNMAVEVLRSVNFYQFSNPESRLKKVYLFGGGANILHLTQMFKEMMPELEFHDAAELVPDAGRDGMGIDDAFLAVGVALN